MDELTLSKYWDLLNAHDWFHRFSDDGRVDGAGADNYTKLVRLCGLSYERGMMLQAFDAWADGVVRGEKIPKPERPEPLTKPVDGGSESW